MSICLCNDCKLFPFVKLLCLSSVLRGTETEISEGALMQQEREREYLIQMPCNARWYLGRNPKQRFDTCHEISAKLRLLSDSTEDVCKARHKLRFWDHGKVTAEEFYLQILFDFAQHAPQWLKPSLDLFEPSKSDFIWARHVAVVNKQNKVGEDMNLTLTKIRW